MKSAIKLGFAVSIIAAFLMLATADAQQVVMANGYKLQRTARPDKVWLFNLTDDPTEQNNIATKHPDLVAKMAAMLDEHNAEQMDTAWPALLESPIWIEKTLKDERTDQDEYIYWPN